MGLFTWWLHIYVYSAREGHFIIIIIACKCCDRHELRSKNICPPVIHHPTQENLPIAFSIALEKLSSIIFLSFFFVRARVEEDWGKSVFGFIHEMHCKIDEWMCNWHQNGIHWQTAFLEYSSLCTMLRRIFHKLEIREKETQREDSLNLFHSFHWMNQNLLVSVTQNFNLNLNLKIRFLCTETYYVFRVLTAWVFSEGKRFEDRFQKPKQDLL